MSISKKQVSDGPNGARRFLVVHSSTHRLINARAQGIRGSRFFMGTPAKCLPVSFTTVFSTCIHYQ